MQEHQGKFSIKSPKPNFIFKSHTAIMTFLVHNELLWLKPWTLHFFILAFKNLFLTSIRELFQLFNVLFFCCCLFLLVIKLIFLCLKWFFIFIFLAINSIINLVLPLFLFLLGHFGTMWNNCSLTSPVFHCYHNMACEHYRTKRIMGEMYSLLYGVCRVYKKWSSTWVLSTFIFFFFFCLSGFNSLICQLLYLTVKIYSFFITRI